MSVLEHLIAADRIVLAGLSAYDEATSRSLAEHERLLAERERLLTKLGDTPEENSGAHLDAHAERIRLGRGELHRALWLKALALLASSAPEKAK